MKPYEKTPNLFETYKDKPHIGKYDLLKFRCPTFPLLRSHAWIYTEKIDGTNMRLILRRDTRVGVLRTDIRGRSNKAQIPGDLKDNMLSMFESRYAKFDNLLSYDTMEGVTLYGEGYGPGIQKGGGDYRKDKAFVLFDVARWTRHEDDSITQYYLPRDQVENLGEHLQMVVAPQVFNGLGLGQLTKRVKQGFDSKLAKFQGGERIAEGIIAQAPGLWHFYDGKVRRMKFKLKTKMFIQEMQTASS